MKKRTRWKRVYNPIIGVRFFDGGNYRLGYFTIEKLWKCKSYNANAETVAGSHWFDEYRMKVRTDEGLVYKMPFCPWMKAYDSSGKKSLSDYYNEDSFMMRNKAGIWKSIKH